MNQLERNIINSYGTLGKQWLNTLAELMKQIEASYGLSNLKPVENLSYNYVLSGLQGSRPIMLKLGFDTTQLNQETIALNSFNGFGTISVLEANEGMLLLERAVPGMSLRRLFPEKDNEAIHIACKCLRRLHQAPIPHAHPFPNIKDWLMALDKDLGIPADHLQKARKLRDELLATAAPPVLLHGDLHHDNILKSGNHWVVIDPKGVIGEPAYEVAAFIRNPMPELLLHQNIDNIIQNRITECAKALKLSKQRIINWSYVQSVLAWAWALEDSHDDTYFRTLTELLNNHL